LTKQKPRLTDKTVTAHDMFYYVLLLF